jgi:putative lipoprotein
MRRLAAAGLLVAFAFSVRLARADEPDPWLSRDKAFHFDVAAGVAAGTYAISAAYLVDARWKAIAIGGGVTLALGGVKEGLDALGLGDPSWKDFTWDVIGAVAGLAIAWGVDVLVGGVDASHPALGAPAGASTANFAVRF